jgi:2,4-dienoyl-CoA reductase-like NADH-dependent reductase (Old Yellow Enzyme family)
MSIENARRILQRDPNPHLFRPLALRSVTVRNRIMMSPMCQYSATDGLPDDWHFAHLAARAVGGAGIVCVEATHVEPRGRITKFCLGLWNDAQRDRLARIAAFIERQKAVPAIQLGHAGRKASVTRPWEGTKPLTSEDGGWEVIGPSPLTYDDRYGQPREMDAATISTVIEAFAASARRAREAGFRIVELHAGHGYLFHQFLSPLSNRRADGYGGSLANRARLLLETVLAVRAEWPADLPLFVRLSATDWVEGGFQIGEAVEVSRMLKATGDVDLIDCTSGGNDPRQRIPIHPGYQVGFAETIRREAQIPTAALGLIFSPEMAEEIVANGRADIVVLGRAMLFDPHWPLHAANTLKARNVSWPVQYERANIF